MGLARGCEEAVDILLSDDVIGGIELALDGVEFACAACSGDEVDPRVLAGQTQVGSPFAVGPDAVIEVGIAGLGPQIADRQLLEIGALFALGDGSITERVE